MLKKLLFILCLLPSLVFAEEFIEGKDYVTIANPKASPVSRPVITEFFSYGCPWCYKMESTISEWHQKLGNTVKIEKIPVVFKPNWELYAKAYYTAKTLALSEKITPALFKAIQDDKRSLDNNKSMIDFFVAQGVDREIAKSAFENSPSIELQVKNGMSLMAQYQVNAVPAFVINNRYKTDLQMAGSQERLSALISYLLKKPA